MNKITRKPCKLAYYNRCNNLMSEMFKYTPPSLQNYIDAIGKSQIRWLVNRKRRK